MELAIHSLILSIDKLEGVRAISVHVTVSIGSTSITKQEGDLVRGFRSEADKIPEHVRVLKNTERERESMHVKTCFAWNANVYIHVPSGG